RCLLSPTLLSASHSFSFSYSALLLDLFSFPTRRSSDLNNLLFFGQLVAVLHYNFLMLHRIHVYINLLYLLVSNIYFHQNVHNQYGNLALFFYSSSLGYCGYYFFLLFIFYFYYSYYFFLFFFTYLFY